MMLMVRVPSEKGPEWAFVVSKVEVERAEEDGRQIDVVHVWNHGAHAGSIKVQAGEGERFAKWLLGDGRTAGVPPGTIPKQA